ncbi:SMI1/KNR4 family protein [Actinacidiphila glaucinigra]|uniref:SMI1/KNR4 family protein n=1 Tax=Actinacidiphila glaucinigra TaxID=235986 RepID=UPI003D9401E1
MAIGYIREPDRVEIRYLTPKSFAESASAAEEALDGPVDSDVDAVLVREVGDAWRRVTGWLEQNAPESRAALRSGVSPTAIAALEHDLGIQVPAVLRSLWSLTGGDDGVNGAGCLPGNRALMTLDAVADFYQQQLTSQAHQDTLNMHRPEYDRITVWKAAWIPVASYGPADRTSGIYVDAETGYMGSWSRYNEAPGEELDTLVTYLEEVADMLEAPATRDKPGLVGGTLVWGSRLDPGQEGRWQPLAD